MTSLEHSPARFVPLAMLGLITLGACHSDDAPDGRTALILEVDSDMSVPAQIDELRLHITTTHGYVDRTTPLGESRTLPTQLALLASEDPAAAFSVELTGWARGELIVLRTLNVQFVPHQIRMIPIRLVAACRGVSCIAGLSCVDGPGCASATVQRAALLPWKGGQLPPDGIVVDPLLYPARPEAGVPEAGVAADGGDASVSPDPGPDVPSPPPQACGGVVCSPVATCESTTTGSRCVCPAGYTDVAGNGTSCVDVNECVADNGGCHQYATCDNRPGTFVCSCRAGFAGNGVSCVETLQPTVVKITPGDRAVGLWRATDVVVTFSEPMDAQATAAALTVGTPAAVPGSITWDGTGTILTFKPTAPFDYGANVAIAVGPGARDRSGNPIATAAASSFKIVRLERRQLFGIGPDGYVRSTGAVLAQALVVGDTETMGKMESLRGFVTFDVSVLSPEAVVRTADLQVYQGTCNPRVYNKLGRLLCEPVVFGDTLEAQDYSIEPVAPPGSLAGVLFTPADATRGWKHAAVEAAVQHAIAQQTERKGLLQFRIRFEIDRSNDAENDICGFSASSAPGMEPRLELQIEVP